MKIPKRFKIGGHWFTVKFRNRTDDGFDVTGRKNSWNNEIVLQAEAEFSKQFSTLLHEAVHEIAWQNDLRLTETQVASISEGLFQVLVDNKLLKE